MSANAISSYLTTYNASQNNSVGSTAAKDNNTLDMNDFITLLVAQLKNQDMYNTTDNTEFISQMAQFSMVQAITDMNKQTANASTFNLIGKGATVSVDSQKVSGVIQGVTLYNGEAMISINGNLYSPDDLTEVFDASLLDGK